MDIDPKTLAKETFAALKGYVDAALDRRCAELEAKIWRELIEASEPEEFEQGKTYPTAAKVTHAGATWRSTRKTAKAPSDEANAWERLVPAAAVAKLDDHAEEDDARRRRAAQVAEAPKLLAGPALALPAFSDGDAMFEPRFGPQ